MGDKVKSRLKHLRWYLLYPVKRHKWGEKKKKFLHQNKCGWEKRQQTTRKGGKQVEDEGNVICQSQLRNSMQLLEKKNMHGWNNAKKLVR